MAVHLLFRNSILVALLLTRVASSDELVDSYAFAGMETRVLLVTGKTSGPDKIVEIARAEERQMGQDAVVRHVIVVSHAADTGHQTLSYERNYRDWRRNRMRFDVLPHGLIAELLSMRDCSAVRIRTPTGVIEKTLRGGNCFRFTIADRSYVIVHIGPWRRFAGSSVFKYFFIQADAPPDKASAESVFRHLQSKLMELPFGVYIRPDSWFGSDPRYPLVAPFEPSLTKVAPAPGDLVDTPSVACQDYGRGVECRVFRGI